MVFLDAESISNVRKYSAKGSKSKMAANFGSNILHDSISTDMQ